MLPLLPPLLEAQLRPLQLLEGPLLPLPPQVEGPPLPRPLRVPRQPLPRVPLQLPLLQAAQLLLLQAARLRLLQEARLRCAGNS